MLWELTVPSAEFDITRITTHFHRTQEEVASRGKLSPAEALVRRLTLPALHSSEVASIWLIQEWLPTIPLHLRAQGSQNDEKMASRVLRNKPFEPVTLNVPEVLWLRAEFTHILWVDYQWKRPPSLVPDDSSAAGDAKDAARSFLAIQPPDVRREEHLLDSVSIQSHTPSAAPGKPQTALPPTVIPVQPQLAVGPVTHEVSRSELTLFHASTSAAHYQFGAYQPRPAFTRLFDRSLQQWSLLPINLHRRVAITVGDEKGVQKPTFGAASAAAATSTDAPDSSDNLSERTVPAYLRAIHSGSPLPMELCRIVVSYMHSLPTRYWLVTASDKVETYRRKSGLLIPVV
jgi:hypothetical protein